MIIFELVCFVRNEPAGQRGPGDSVTIIPNERRSIALPPRVNPSPLYESRLLGERFLRSNLAAFSCLADATNAR